MSEKSPLFEPSSYSDTSNVEVEGKKKRSKNWPAFCPAKLQCLYHNIYKEIKMKPLRPFVYREYTFYYISIATFIINFIACASRLSAKDDLSHAVGDFIGSLICLVVLIPAFFIVYFTLYRSIRDNGLTHVLFYILAVARSILEIIFSIGIPGAGSAGLGTMIQAFKKGKNTIGFINLVAFLTWSSIAVFHTLSLILIFRMSQKLKRGEISRDVGGKELGNVSNVEDPKSDDF